MLNVLFHFIENLFQNSLSNLCIAINKVKFLKNLYTFTYQVEESVNIILKLFNIR